MIMIFVDETKHNSTLMTIFTSFMNTNSLQNIKYQNVHATHANNVYLHYLLYWQQPQYY